MIDQPMLPMPGLELPPLRTYTVEWVMRGKLTVVGSNETIARAEANELSPQRLVLFSDAVTLEKSEPKEVEGE